MSCRIPSPGSWRQWKRSTFSRDQREVRRTGKGQILAARGRRQVGKSTAVTAFVEQVDTSHAYITGVKRAPMHRQLKALAEASLGSRHPVADTHLLFDTCQRRGERRSTDGPLPPERPRDRRQDEFPRAVETGPSLEGKLQVAWDTTLSKLPILLILIGSDVAMMSRLMEHDRPLFGRVTPMVVPAPNPLRSLRRCPGDPQ